jgi:hypothetical protein
MAVSYLASKPLGKEVPWAILQESPPPPTLRNGNGSHLVPWSRPSRKVASPLKNPLALLVEMLICDACRDGSR